MKKIIYVLISILFISTAVLAIKLKSEPPSLENKFVQDNEKPITDNLKSREGFEETVNKIQVKTPGSSALVTLPTHTYQTFNNCGPATLSMILAFNGKNVSQKELGEQMRPYQIPSGDNDDKTIFTYEFVQWAEKYGFKAIDRVNGDIDLLKTFTTNGIPVVVKTWLHVNEDIGHFRIVRGFDEGESGLPAGRQVIIQDDSYEGPNKKISYYDFLSMWQPFNYAYIIVYTPGQEDLVSAIIGSEMDEKVAWQNSLVRAQKEEELDSQNVYPLFNQSMAYYRLDDYEASVDTFEKVENRLPRRMLWYEIEPILAYRKLEDYERAFRIIDKILNNGNRAFSELYQIRGEIYLAQRNKDAARKEFELALQYNKNFLPAQESLKNL